jgi:adenine-specific DNA-methyltransferase
MPARPRLELVWPGKDQFLLTPSGDDGKPVWVDRDHPAAHEVRLTEFTGAHGQVNDTDPYADNLVFTGDSLDVLRVLCEVPEYRRHYRGKIRQIYIDSTTKTNSPPNSVKRSLSPRTCASRCSLARSPRKVNKHSGT